MENILSFGGYINGTKLYLENVRFQRSLHIVLQGLSPKTEAKVPTESTDRLTLLGVLDEERGSKHSRKLVICFSRGIYTVHSSLNAHILM